MTRDVPDVRHSEFVYTHSGICSAFEQLGFRAAVDSYGRQQLIRIFGVLSSLSNKLVHGFRAGA